MNIRRIANCVAAAAAVMLLVVGTAEFSSAQSDAARKQKPTEAGMLDLCEHRVGG